MGIAALAIWLIYQFPPVKYHLEWRLDAFATMVRMWIRPGETVPVPAGAATSHAQVPTSLPTPIRTPSSTLTPTPGPTVTPIPSVILLEPPQWEKQDWNNCGPATLSLALRYYGWEGDQFAISDLLKPDRGDRNVNIEELAYFVRTRAGWLRAEYRVGGRLETMKRFVAAGLPIVVEKGTTIDEGGGGWAGHYALVTGYDDAAQVFITQDTYRGPDQRVTYVDFDANWQAFNRVYFLVYPESHQEDVERLLGDDLDLDANRARALAAAESETAADPINPFAWFNQGTNLVYFERYGEAARAFDEALELGLPWRFTRYQFGPYIAYFNQGRFQDIVDLADATLYRTQKAEESLLWRGWARYRLGEWFPAVEDFRAALKVNPNYLDAQYALEYIGSSP
jgi:tetratricopeptide (TPR) repeat protein